MSIYAIVETGGKQYKAEPDKSLRIESIQAEPGSIVELDSVLAVSKDGEMSLGNPTVKDAKVIAEVVRHGRDKKVIVFKYKSKTRYRKKNGHRQGHTIVLVKDIVTKKKRTRKARAKKSEGEEDGS